MSNCTRVWLLIGLVWSSGSLAMALAPSDVPAEPPNDSIMASPTETAGMADWAAAAFAGGDTMRPSAKGEQKSGERDSPPLLSPAGPPFSFVLGGKPSRELLKDWKRTTEAQDLPDRVRHRVAWTDPGSGLRVSAEVVVYKGYAAADWVLRFENAGKQDTPILEDIQALDVTLRTASANSRAHCTT